METLFLEEEVSPVDVENLDHRRLQGTWEYLAGPREAQLTLAGDHFTVRFRNGEIYFGTFRLGTAGRPKMMDMIIDEGPDRHKGLKSLAIYAIDGDRLIWSTGRPGSSERPRFFPAPEDREPLCIVFQRNREDGVPASQNKPRSHGVSMRR